MSASEDVFAARIDAVPRGIGHVTDIVCDRADNAEIWDLEGRRYVDFAAGIAVCNTGHNHPDVKAAVIAQLDRFTHTSFNVAIYPQYIELAQRLNALVPGAPAQTMLLSTGAEAVESSQDCPRRHRRPAVIAFSGGFHGRTMRRWRSRQGGSLQGRFGPFRRSVSRRLPDEAAGLRRRRIASIRGLFRTSIDATRVAAIIIEPVQGEGGFNTLRPRCCARFALFATNMASF